ncbi:MAG: DUF882 domain-containing protein [Alphaproteobacteria bacterium]|nr:DUF882 domain-containing protein [Alphaproteobacteria bacterium]
MKMSIPELKAYKLSSNFSLDEFVCNHIATTKNIDNTPNEADIKKMGNLCANILQPLRNHFGKTVTIRRGYLCPKLNTALGYTPKSQHTVGEAVDITVSGVYYKKVTEWIADNLNYDVLSWEWDPQDTKQSGHPWIHVSYVSKEFNRRYDLTSYATLKKIKLSANFTLYELIHSETAYYRNIFNVPDETGIEKLRLVCENVLQKVREHFGRSVRVNSGYRSPRLNAAIKGSAKNSQHMKCEAADFEIIGMDNFELAKWVQKNLVFDQVILEFHGDDSDDPNDGWVHTSYVEHRKNRMQALTINNYGTKQGLHKK